MLQYGRHARPDDKCQDQFSLKAAKSRLSIPIFFASEDFHSIVAAIHRAFNKHFTQKDAYPH
jgi:hypothetical protein